MSEQITGEQLERAAYHDNNTTAHCHECGANIDVEQDTYGQSIDGEKYCCYDCREDFARLHTLFCNHINRWLADAGLHKDGRWGDGECVETRHANEHEALKRAAEMAEMVWGVKSYIERG